MGDSSEKLNFTAEQLKFFLETCIDETKNKANNLRNSPLLYPDLYTYLYEKCAASGPNHVPFDEGGSSVPPPTNENHDVDFDPGYDNDFEGGSPVPPPKSPTQSRPKKKAKGGVSEFEDDMKQAIINLAKGGFSKNKGHSADELKTKQSMIK
ncbi:hypothetical protein Tco_0549438 [Tanacetum coccineum]